MHIFHSFGLRHHLALCLLLLSSSPLVAAEPARQAPQEQDEATHLLSMLDQLTDLATKTRMNADHVPGIVTVLEGRDLELQGAHTVWDALQRVAGIQQRVDFMGAKVASVRGMGADTVSGVKPLLNGINVNDPFRNMDWLMDMPIEQVERIELIRGPGSAVHGEYAYGGVLNIVTKKQGTRLFGSHGRYNSWTGGGNYDWQSDSGYLGFNVSFSATRTDGADSLVEEDTLATRLAGLNAGVSNAPGPANQDYRTKHLVAQANYRDFTLAMHWLDRKNGDHYGFLAGLPEPDEGLVEFTHTLGFDLSQKRSWNPELNLEWHVGWQHYTHHADLNFFPGPFIWLNPDATTILFNEGVTSQFGHNGQRVYGKAELTWRGWQDHTLLAGIELSKSRVIDSTVRVRFDPQTLIGSTNYQTYQGSEVPYIDEDGRRTLTSLYLQDEYRFDPQWRLTVGGRYDRYAEAGIGDHFSPRVGLLWEMDDHNLFKFHYAHGFRPPMVYYATTDPSLVPESVDSVELSYLYHRPDFSSRITGYWMKVQDLIMSSVLTTSTDAFTNYPKALQQGVELEATWKPQQNLKIAANATLQRGRLKSYDGSWYNRVSTLGVMANLDLTWSPRQDHLYHLYLHHKGEEERWTQDSRPSMDGYTTLDLAASWLHVGYPGLTMKMGIKNVADSDVRVSSSLTNDLLGNLVPTIRHDFPLAGRTWWLGMSVDY
uniref:Putative TonB-dependent receptor n=1 Tax=Magnetococcus massalia (strain MO-1) TaxID=451514 RepID=A0A1S7LMW2_MAGMO|nr:putative TonB-dependent receptor [Candidatus Magnetococcus massalia]